MSASCYVGCAPGHVGPPTVAPPVGPHPLAFTGAGYGLHEMLAIGVCLVLIGATILISRILINRRDRRANSLLVIDTGPKVRRYWGGSMTLPPVTPYMAPGVDDAWTD